jgi:hypothetical protein
MLTIATVFLIVFIASLAVGFLPAKPKLIKIKAETPRATKKRK